MLQACNEFYELSQNQGRRWQRTVQHEYEQRQKLEEMVETLAKNVVSLEKKARMSISGQPIKETGESLNAVLFVVFWFCFFVFVWMPQAYDLIYG